VRQTFKHSNSGKSVVGMLQGMFDSKSSDETTLFKCVTCDLTLNNGETIPKDDKKVHTFQCVKCSQKIFVAHTTYVSTIMDKTLLDQNLEKPKTLCPKCNNGGVYQKPEFINKHSLQNCKKKT
jgi:DNA-directed RNA polymerase subunit RPC12/RpoP